MSAQNKATIKSYFETGDRPTQGQFSDLVDSYQDINSNLTALASAGTGTVGLQLLSCNTSASAASVLGLQALAFLATVSTNVIDNLAVTTGKLATTAVSAGTYNNPIITVGVDGRITSATNNTLPTIGFGNFAKVHVTNPSAGTLANPNNIATVNRTGAGQFTVTMSSAAANSDYVPLITCRKDTAPTAYASQIVIAGTTSFSFQVYDGDKVLTDPQELFIAVFS